jgi:hypothetical protein
MKQLELVSLVTSDQADFTWLPLAEALEVMAWPVRVAGAFVAVSARTASACAAALTRADWLVSLTTPALEDQIYDRARHRPEPVLLDPQRIDLASGAAIAQHSQQLLTRLATAPRDALVACGKSWVLTNELLRHPGRAANYGLFFPTAPHASATGRHRLWQPLSFAHDLDHFDYSQLLRLVRRRPGIPLPTYDPPLRVFELIRTATPPPPAGPPAPAATTALTLGERCLAWCLEEAARHPLPSAERIAWYHAIAIRNGAPLGITRGNHCASAQSRALVESLVDFDLSPHEPRASVIEIEEDAKLRGLWHPIAEVRSGAWRPRAGDLATYDRAVPGEWQRHVDRVVQVSDDAERFESIGANEVGGAWRREWTAFGVKALRGFVEYPGSLLWDD